MTEPLYELEAREFDGGRGFVVRRIMDGQRLRWQTLPKRDGLESFNVAGTSHHADAMQHPSFAPGKPLSLLPEPLNPYDPNADVQDVKRDEEAKERNRREAMSNDRSLTLTSDPRGEHGQNTDIRTR
jgi:hypothetical protein